MSNVPLRDHQKEALDAIIRGLMAGPDGVLPARGLRGTVLMATGTGKTRTASVAAQEIVPDGLVGVMVPTLDLITQTVEEWREAGHREPMIAVCSLKGDPLLEKLGVRCTTNPTQLALWTSGKGPVTVFATYASLAGQGLEEDDGESAPGVLERAARGASGQKMPAFDLLILDEAHRTSGDGQKSWAAVLDQERIPAHRRLFMTATRRLWEVPKAGGESRVVASMDDVQLYGNVLFELPLLEAIERGILANFVLEVLEISDPDVEGPGLTVEEIRGRRLASLQAALLRHHHDVGVRSLLTFHNRTVEAMAMARALPETAAELYQVDPRMYPKRVAADWLSGEHPSDHRRTVLRRFADGVDKDGWVNDFQVLASCQVLGEGVDITGRRGVDGVVFADPRSSAVQIFQGAGRALRQKPGEGKLARLIVPIFLQPGENPDHMSRSSSYRPLAALLQALRSHDARIVERLLAARSGSGRSSRVLELDPEAPQRDNDEGGEAGGVAEVGTEESTEGAEMAAPALTADDGPAGVDADGYAGEHGEGEGHHRQVTTPLLWFSLPRNPDVVARFLRTRVIPLDTQVWITGLEALRLWVEENKSAEVPQNATIQLDGEDYSLGLWVSEQRRAYQAGVLKPWRVERLDELGMVWSVRDRRFTEVLVLARACFERYGTLAVPVDTVIDGAPFGKTMMNLRRKNGLGAKAKVAEERDAALKAIDPYWNPGWRIDWQQAYTALAQLVGEEKSPEVPPPGVIVNTVDVGKWVAEQQRDWGLLSGGQRELLTKLGMAPELPKAGTVAALTVEGTQPGAVVAGLAVMSAFERGVAALAAFKAREGHLKVPRTHIEVLRADPAEADAPGWTAEVPVRAGVFSSNAKARRAKLAVEQLAALAALGLEWAQ
ncbi:Helicase associated domain protein [Streptomyces xiamenensis]|uniref:DEAD/DEAH box helicase n=1 Tax=Streptomyces xiamenensis TaxID=408015 RepID=UPI0035D7E273